MGSDLNSATVRGMPLARCVLTSAEPDGGGIGGWERGKRGWFGDMVLETWKVATSSRNLSGGHGGSSLAIILRGM